MRKDMLHYNFGHIAIYFAPTWPRRARLTRHLLLILFLKFLCTRFNALIHFSQYLAKITRYVYDNIIATRDDYSRNSRPIALVEDEER